MIVVTAAVIVKDRKVFAARRGKGKHLEGCWEFPGGKLEQGESPEECLRRELVEEFGIDAQVGNLVGESIYDYGNKVIRLMSYRVTHITGEFKLHDHDEIRWLSIENLMDVEWAPADIPLLENVRKILSAEK